MADLSLEIKPNANSYSNESTGKKEGLKLRFILVGLLILVTGFILGFVTKNLTDKNTDSLVEASKLPIDIKLLQNPIVYEWRGSIEGKLVSQDGSNFTLEDAGGNRITITSKTPSGGIFRTIFSESSQSGPKQIELKDIPNGTLLRGDFFIFKGGSNTPVGGSFQIMK